MFFILFVLCFLRMVRDVGIEPTTRNLEDPALTTELIARLKFSDSHFSEELYTFNALCSSIQRDIGFSTRDILYVNITLLLDLRFLPELRLLSCDSLSCRITSSIFVNTLAMMNGVAFLNGGSSRIRTYVTFSFKGLLVPAGILPRN